MQLRRIITACRSRGLRISLQQQQQQQQRNFSTTLSSKANEQQQQSVIEAAAAQAAVDIEMVTLEDIEDAYVRIKPLLPPTPLSVSQVLSAELFKNYDTSNRQSVQPLLYLKYENKHLTGSFKERGAINKMTLLTEDERRRGVICCSAGNHAQAVAYHAMRLGMSATVCMPETTPLAKVQGTMRFGANIVLSGDSLDDAYKVAMQIGEKEHRVFIHPFNDHGVIAGQGTLGLELMEQNPYIDTVICPIGGGGLIGGLACALKNVNPKIKVYGVEAENMPSASLSRQNKNITAVPFNATIADGIAVKAIGDRNFELLNKYVDDIVTVNENEIAHSVLTLLEREKTLSEGAGSTGLAALLFKKLPHLHQSNMKHRRICVILSGGNIDVTVLREIVDRGLVASGRLARFRVTVPDVPGQLAQVLTTLAELKCNVREVDHDRNFNNIPLGYTTTQITVTTKGFDHVEQVLDTFQKKGWRHELS
jgi:threonine dehydratase